MPGVFLPGMIEDVPDGSLFHDPAGLHHHYPVTKKVDHVQIVGNEQKAQVQVVPQLLQQLQDLGLDGDVQGADRFVGDQEAVDKVAQAFGNSTKKLDAPNLASLFFGIVLGVTLGSLPIALPGLGQPFKLGIAGGALIIAILIGAFGPKYHLVTYTTSSANLMIREIGIALFLAAVGFGAGKSFIPTLLGGGYMWIGYGVLITLVPLIIFGIIGRLCMKLDYFTLMGMIAGSTTDPPALAYATSQSSVNDRAAVAYSTVYPLTMFLRVLTGQLMILFFL